MEKKTKKRAASVALLAVGLLAIGGVGVAVGLNGGLIGPKSSQSGDPADGVEVWPNEINIRERGTQITGTSGTVYERAFNLTATMANADSVTYPYFSWTSSDTSAVGIDQATTRSGVANTIYMVDADGYFANSVTITAKALDGSGLTATCTVTAYDFVDFANSSFTITYNGTAINDSTVGEVFSLGTGSAYWSTDGTDVYTGRFDNINDVGVLLTNIDGDYVSENFDVTYNIVTKNGGVAVYGLSAYVTSTSGQNAGTVDYSDPFYNAAIGEETSRGNIVTIEFKLEDYTSGEIYSGYFKIGDLITASSVSLTSTTYNI